MEYPPPFTDGIDLTYLKTVSDGDENFELTMIETLIVEIDQKMNEIGSSIFVSNLEGIRLQAHSLKNLYGVLGAGLLKEHFLAIESRCTAMPKEVLHQQFLACEKEWHTKKMALDKVMASYKTRLL